MLVDLARLDPSLSQRGVTEDDAAIVEQRDRRCLVDRAAVSVQRQRGIVQFEQQGHVSRTCRWRMRRRSA